MTGHTPSLIYSLGETYTACCRPGENQVVTLTARPWEGYRFLKWSGASSSAETTVEFRMTGPAAYRASFERIPPTGPVLVPRLVNGEFLVLQYTLKAGFVHKVQDSADLAAWRDLQPESFTDSAGKVDVFLPFESGSTRKFYRLNLSPGGPTTPY